MGVNPSNNLDLNSDAVYMDERNEISRARLNESSGMISVSLDETQQVEGGLVEVRVSSGEENVLELLFKGSGEGNLNETAAVNVASTSVNDGGDEKSPGGFDSSTSNEAQKVGNGVIRVERFSESLAEETEVVIDGKAAEVPNKGVLSTREEVVVKDGSPEENQSMEAAADGGSRKEVTVSSLGANTGVCENTSSRQDEKEASVDQVAEAEVFETHLNENQRKEAHVTEIVTTAKQDDNQNMGSHALEVSVTELADNGPNFGSIVIDFGIYPNTNGNQNTGDEGFNPLAEHHSGKVEVEEIRSEFSVSNLVWGKVSSHPWWPGQIFDPRDSSKLAMKHNKMDRERFLVAYFGDQTFAWNVASSLKPFQTHFSQMVKQTDMEAFRYAVGSALDEISRRVQLGLACSCTPDEAYDTIKSQIIKNAGIRAQSSRREGLDKNFSVAAFEPGKLLHYYKALALNPCGGVDRLELVVAKAQLMAFYRSKGVLQLPEFCMLGGLLDYEPEHQTPIPKSEIKVYSVKRKLKSEEKLPEKRQKTSEDNLNPTMRERSLSELMGDEYTSSKSSSQHSSKKRKAVGSFSDDLNRKTMKPRLSQSSNEDTKSQSPRSFKIGESIRRIASQLKGSPSILTSSSGRVRKPTFKTAIPKEYSSPDEMLSQLHLAARDPMKGYSFLTIIVGFFTDFRNSISLDLSSSGKKKVSQKKFSGGKSGGKSRKWTNTKANSSETSSYEDMSDSSWEDRTIHSSPEEQSSHKQKSKGKPKRKTPMKKDGNTVELEKYLQSGPVEVSKECNPTNGQENSLQVNSAMDSEEQHPDGDNKLVQQEPVHSSNKNDAEEISPTALILNFTEADSIPSEMDLNKIFNRYGPLKESETEVLKKTNRAKVVFKKRNDAEVAFSSAGKFSIFGPALASYQLRYLPSTPSKASSHLPTE